MPRLEANTLMPKLPTLLLMALELLVDDLP